MYKERHKSVTICFTIWIILAFITSVGHFESSSILGLLVGNTDNSLVLCYMYLLDVAFFALILNWKFIGIIGIVLSAITKVYFMLPDVGKIEGFFASIFAFFQAPSTIFYTLAAFLGRLAFLAIFFIVLTRKTGGYSTLHYLLMRKKATSG